MTWLVLAGRGFGKTRTGAEWIREEVTAKRMGRIALIAETQKDLEEVMVFGDSGINSVFPPHQRPKITKKPVRVEFHTGAVAFGYNATEPDQLRGPQFDGAWCFVAGTMVSTPTGGRPIETIKVGDFVETRAGPRRVAATCSRPAQVGRVCFSNGSDLTGTPEHPIYLKSGWTRLDQLRIGDAVCAINASSGAVKAGTATTAGITSERIRALSQGSRGGFIEKCGSKLTGLSRRVSKFTIEMKTRATTTWATLSCSRRALTCATTEKLSQYLRRIGPLRQLSPLSVSDVPLHSLVSARRPTRFVSGAPTVRLRSVESGQCAVSSAGLSSCLGLETIAVSVASTWQHMGEQEVFCLTVEGAPEYFANGILVHNCDELAKWRYARETWDQLQFGLRLGKRPRQIVTTTPRPIPILKEILAADTTVVTRGVTTDNRANLAASFIKSITEKYAGTRLGRQELSAEILDDVPDALWTRAALDRDRRKPDQVPPLRRVVVAVDPAAKKNDVPEDGAATGIVVAGVGEDGRGYVLDDATCRESPNGWARKAIACFDRYEGDCIVGEINNGGDMVASTVRAVRTTVPFKEVTASRGKWVRAEPIAALYEQGRISHVGTFASLEDEMVNFGPNGPVGDACVDRVDALVWALTELFPSIVRRTIKAVAAPKSETPVHPQSWMG